MPTLPGAELPKPKSWDEFEEICWDIFTRKWPDPEAKRYGRSGQPQQGVDVYGRPPELNGGYAGVQCKRYDDGKLTRKVIETEIDKAEGFQPALAKFVIATTEGRDAKLQEAVREINQAREGARKFAIDILFWDDLCHELLREENEDLLRRHYADWLRVFGGERVGPPLELLPRAEYFKDREAELKTLLEDLKPGAVIEICGPGGMGKTALAAEALHALTRGGTQPPQDFPDGVIVHSFYKQADVNLAFEQIARSYAVEAKPTPAQAARALLAAKQALLVLDGAEAALDLAALLEMHGRCAVLLTSRRREAQAKRRRSGRTCRRSGRLKRWNCCGIGAGIGRRTKRRGSRSTSWSAGCRWRWCWRAATCARAT